MQVFLKLQRIMSGIFMYIPFSENERPETLERIRTFRGS